MNDSPHGPTFEPVPISDQDRYLFNEGTHRRLYDLLGAHLMVQGGRHGVRFAVWAPNARRVEVLGEFNDWGRKAVDLHQQVTSGIWTVFVPGLEPGALYKYRVHSSRGGYVADKADPIGFRHEVPPHSASIVATLDYQWHDQAYMAERRTRNALSGPISIYEIHAGSWRRNPDEGHRYLSYRELARELPQYLKETGFTHVEFMPLMEHPYFLSWGYQTTGYFAATSRYGSPQDLMHLVDVLHQNGFGVIFDWSAAHFPNDGHGLVYFDGTHLYEHEDPRRGFHPDWRSCIFNYGRNEVRAFLISSALFWFDKYHIDGLRVDGVASMLYLDYSRKEGEWLANRHGGRENLEAIEFLRQLNTAVYAEFPDVHTIAEESTAWPQVSRPVYSGGLGFGMKWDMGWMHDTLKYMVRDPIHRRHHHNELTFRAVYAHHENFVLPLSHDEVVHGKGALLAKMPGDDWQKVANLRLLYAYMWSLPGKKLLFMGSEFGQWHEWNVECSLDWHLLAYERHQGIQRLVSDLNALLKREPALHELDFEPAGFEWIELSDADNSVLAYTRRAPGSELIVLLNFTPVLRQHYRVGVDPHSEWQEILNTDHQRYGGSGAVNEGPRHGAAVAWRDKPHSFTVTLPPLGASILRRNR